MLTTQVKWSVNYESQVQKQCSTSTSNGRNAASVPWVLAETSDKTTKTPCNGAALPLRKPTYPLNWSFSPDMLIFLGGTPWTFWAQVDQIWPICCFVHTVDLSMFQICLLGQICICLYNIQIYSQNDVCTSIVVLHVLYCKILDSSISLRI